LGVQRRWVILSRPLTPALSPRGERGRVPRPSPTQNSLDLGLAIGGA